MSDFKGRHFEGETVLWAVRWYCRYGVSYRDLSVSVSPSPRCFLALSWVWDGLKFHRSSALLRWLFAMRSITAAI